MDGEAWEQAKPTVPASLGLPADAAEHLDARAALLDGIYREAAARLPANAQSTVEDDGRLGPSPGGGLVASVDGMRFVVPVPSVYARPNPERFGRGRVSKVPGRTR